jgi:putative aldouronate transport system substrate-binding protein
MKKLYKITAIIIASLLILSMAACTTNGDDIDIVVVRDASDTDDFKMSELTTVNTALSWNADWYPSQYSAGNNPIYDLYKSAVNINMVNKFELPWEGYEQQITSAFITSDYPDIFFVSAKMLDELIRNEAILDITEYYKQWGTQELKDTLSYNNNINFSYCIQGGKMYGIPKVTDDCDRPTVWSRLDWIKNLNERDNTGKTLYDTVNSKRFNENGPQSLEEFWALAEACALEDPDGNGKKDTYGISMSSALDATTIPIFNAYNAYPTSFVENDDGTWSNLGINNEMKAPLQKLAEMVAKGVIDSDYINWSNTDAWSKAASGYAGITLGPAYIPTWPLSNTLAIGGDWIASKMCTVDGSEFIPSRNLNVSGYYVVRKGYAHPEALIKILNNLATSDETNEWYQGYITASEPVTNSSIFNWMPISIDRSTVNFERHTAFMYAIEKYEETGEFDLSMIEARDIVRWNQVKNYYLYQSSSGWAMYKTFYEGVTIAKSYGTNGDSGVYNMWNYPSTKTMKLKETYLDQMTAQTRLAIISGKINISAFDDYVTDWNNGGGLKILNEMQAYITSQRG